MTLDILLSDEVYRWQKELKMEFDPKKKRADQAVAIGEVIKLQSSEEAAQEQALLVALKSTTGITKLQDAQYASDGEAKVEVTRMTPYELPSSVVNSSGLPLPEFARNLMAKRKNQISTHREAA